MAEKPTAKQGKDLLLYFRKQSDRAKLNATKTLFQTEHELEKSRDTDTTVTKDGSITSTSGIETSLSMTTLVAVGDEAVDTLEECIDNDELIDIWEIDRAEKNSEGKYKAKYFEGCKVSSFSKNPTAEDLLELDVEFAMNGAGVDGYATLTEEQVKTVQYVFQDVTKQDE